MKISRKSFLVAVSLLAGTAAFSGVISDAAAQAARAGYRWELHKEANVKFEVPSAWVTTTEGNKLVTKPKDGGLAVEFIAVGGAGAAVKAEQQIDKEILKLIPDARVTEPAKPVAQNGLTGVLVKGEGTRAGGPVEFFAVYLHDAKGKGLLSLGVAGKGQIASHRDKLVEVFNSIRPIS